VWTAVSLVAQNPVLAGQRSTTPQTKADESLIVNVPASSPWTDTGVTVHAGDRLQIRAWGRVSYGGAAAGRGFAPAGLGRGGDCSFVVADARVPAHSLVANIAPELTFEGSGILVGSTWSATVPVPGTTAPEGRLFVGINHGGMLCDRTGYDSWAFRNNSFGAFTVDLAIRRRR
jgi:hypothetical protein